MNNPQPKKRRGKQSKFTNELQSRILELAKVCKTDKEIYEAVGISKDSFYRYLSDHSDFSDLFTKARSQKSIEQENALVWDRRQAAEDYIELVYKRQVWKQKKKYRQVLNRQGEIVTLVDIEEEQIMPQDVMRILDSLPGSGSGALQVNIQVGEETFEEERLYLESIDNSNNEDTGEVES